MATINQIISSIPDAGHRGVDARTLFVSKQETFQDAITDAFVPQLNTFKTEANLLASEVNSLRNATLALRNETENIRNLANTQTQAQVALATTQAGAATTKASEANTSANQALTYKNQLQGYVIPAGTSYNVDQINTQNSAMTKAQFNALAEERKANRAGSGFDEMGWARSSWIPVNDGLGVSTNIPNLIYFGDSPDLPSKGIGQVSRTPYPIATISGTTHKLKYTGNMSYNYAILPIAPNIYPYNTVLTAEQIASGVIKHADASNSGLIVNGKFDTDTSGWSVWKTSILSVESNRLNVNAIGVIDDLLIQPFAVIAGKTYIIELEKIQGSSVRISVGNSNSNYTGEQYLGVNNIDNGKYIVNFTVNVTGTVYLKIKVNNSVGIFDNIAVYPADAISRQDFVFIKQNIENIATKDFFVPLGNKQYLGGDVDGITGISVGAFSGATTSSLFGTWQVAGALVGKGYVWSTRTEAQKKALLANPENNAYLDGADIYQATYMTKVINLPNDNYTESTAFAYVGYMQDSVDKGLWTHSDGSKAVSVALTSRRNQGMYHPVYNANGSKKASDGNFWYNTAVSFTSISDCFDPVKLLTASGYIGTVSGRPDGLFYDQTHEGDVLDLRNSSKKVEDYNRLISREFNKLVAGTTRGKEGEIVNYEVNYGTTTGLGLVANNYIDFGSGVINGVLINKIQYPNLGNGAYIRFDTSGKTYILKPTFSDMRAQGSGRYLYYVPVDSTGFTSETGTWRLVFPIWTTRTKSNTLLHCDIIGNPTNYPTTWKQNGVFGTPLIVAEDGTSLLPTGSKSTFKLSRKANATPLLCLRSTDNGATWASFTPTFSTTTNEITLTNEPAANLVMVYYQTHTSMAVPTVNSEVLEIGKAAGTNGLASAHLISTLIGKASTASTAPFIQDGYSISNYRIDTSTIKFSTTSTEIPIHNALSLAGGAAGIVTVKVFPYLTRLNGKAYLNLVFKEMKHNGTSWGDNSKFDIVDNVSTTSDNNALPVLIGQKTVELPYFIGADE